jgi:DNA polymerase-1
MKNEKKLFLLDGFALIYRAYFAFAKNPRINSKGVDTSAVFGFVNTLNELIRKENPTHIGVVFDTNKPTERHIEYPEYKAHREAMPEGIRDAIKYIDKLLIAFNIPKIFKDGYEADDVIGTLAKKAEQKGYTVYMMTSDKDFAQLVSENIFMYKPGNKWQPTTIWGVQEVLQNFNIEKVSQVIDYLGMVGDTADNIPGIPGIGKKTAQKFLKEYKSMEGLFENSDKLTGKMRDNVSSSEKIGMLCKKLVTIITDVPIDFNEDHFKYQSINEPKLEELFNELEFKTLLSRMTGSKNQTALNKNSLSSKEYSSANEKQFDLFNEITTQKISELKNSNFEIVETESKIQFILKNIKKEKKFSLQLISNKSTNLIDEIIGLAISFDNKNGYFFKYNFTLLTKIKPIFEDPGITLIGYDLKSLFKTFMSKGVEIKSNLFDIQISHYLLHPESRNSFSLISENYLNLSITDENEVLGLGKTRLSFADLTINSQVNYACERSLCLFKIYKILEKEMRDNDMLVLFEKIEIPLLKVLAKMELEGIAIDQKLLSSLSTDLSKKLEIITNNIHSLAEKKFNISSPKQTGEILFDVMQLSKKPKKTKSGQYSTSEEELKKIKNAHPIINEILTFRGIKKLLSTYVDALPELVEKTTGRVHTTFNQSVTSTGRLSSINPNMQNIPIRSEMGMKVREAFVPKNNDFVLVAADYSQIELRLMAALSNDDEMIKAFKNGIDIHSVTAAKVYNVNLNDIDRKMRSNAKSVNFGIIYGISAFGLAQNIGVTRKEAQNIIDNYFEQFPQIRTYMQKSIEEAREKEYTITIMGRKRHLKDINAKNGMIRAIAERNAINAPIQGSAADIIKVAMINIERDLSAGGFKSKMLLQVHDELVFDIHKSEIEEVTDIIRKGMEGAVILSVPLTVDIGSGNNWLEAH